MAFYVSQYLNVYKSHRGSAILFNGISGAIDEVDPNLGDELLKMKRTKGAIPAEYAGGLEPGEFEFLKRRGHICELAPEGELEAFRRFAAKLHALKREKQSKEPFLTLIPSYRCNLRCPYCFQSRINESVHETSDSMKGSFVDEIFGGIARQLFPEAKTLDGMSLCIYGGEPFLSHNEEAIEAIMRHSIAHQMKTTAFSNGTETHRFLKWFGKKPGYISQVQLTIDGDRGDHDSLRRYEDGGGSFDAVIESLHKLIEQGVSISVRVNSTKPNIGNLQGLFKRLEDEEVLGHPRVRVYTWAVHCPVQLKDPDFHISNFELSNITEGLTEKVESPVGRRVRRLRKIVNAKGGLAVTRTSFCMRNTPYAFLLDPARDIYSCYEEAGKSDLRTGYIDRSGRVVLLDNYREFMKREVAKCEPCNRCGVALTCGGGCPHNAECSYGDQYRGSCDSHKACVEKAIVNLFEQKMSDDDDGVFDRNEYLIPNE